MSKNKIITNCLLGRDVAIGDFTNLYGCKIGDNSKIGPFVEIQKNVVVGRNVKIQSHTFICEGVDIEDEVFIGHGVMFVNDKYPRSTNDRGGLKKSKDWELIKTTVKKRASIGTNATILGGIIIGQNAIVGAGSVVTKNVQDNEIVAGNPAKVLRKLKD